MIAPFLVDSKKRVALGYMTTDPKSVLEQYSWETTF